MATRPAAIAVAADKRTGPIKGLIVAISVFFGGLFAIALMPIWGGIIIAAAVVTGAVVSIAKRASTRWMRAWLVVASIACLLGALANHGIEADRKDRDAQQVRQAEEQRAAEQKRTAEALDRMPHTLAAMQGAISAGRWEDAAKLLAEVERVKPDAEGLKEAKARIEPEIAKIAAARDAKERKEAATQEQATRKAEQAEAVRKAKALARLKKEVDDVRGVTFYRHPSTSLSASHLALYFGITNEMFKMSDKKLVAPLRLSLRYFGSDWLFIESVIVKADDQTFTIGEGRWERDSGGGYVWEWVDEPLVDDPVAIKAVQAVLRSKSAKMRFQGRQYYKDRPIPKQEKDAMLDVVEAYIGAGGVDAPNR